MAAVHDRQAPPAVDAFADEKGPQADAAHGARYWQNRSFSRSMVRSGSRELGLDLAQGSSATKPVTIRLSAWERFLAGEALCPCCSFWLFLSLMLLMTVGGFYGGLNLTETGGEVLSNDIVQLYYAGKHLEEEGCIAGEVFDSPVCHPSRAAAGAAEPAAAAANASRPRSLPGSAVLVLFEATGTGCPGKECDARSESLLTERNMRAMKTFEDTMYGSKDFQDDYCLLRYPASGEEPSCVPRTSLVPKLFNGSQPLEGDDLSELLRDVCDPDSSATAPLRRGALPSFACRGGALAEYGTPFLMSSWMMGHDGGNQGELESEYSGKLWKLYQEASRKTLQDTDGEVRPMLFTEFTALKSMESLLIHDCALAVGSFLVVFLYMWFTVESFFLSSMGMLQVIMSCPPAFLVWKVVMPDGVGFLQFLSIFMILGIGADDVFVLVDAWKQARVALGKEGTPAQVFAVAYRRAFSAMLTTTTTTGAAFLFGALSTIPSVSQFCLFAGIVVVFDFLWCITFFASSICVYERFFMGHGCCCFGPAKPVGSCGGPGCCWGALRAVGAARSRARSGGEQPAARSADERALERLCAGPLFGFVRRHRAKLVAFWLLAAVAGASLAAALLKTATKPPEIGDESNDLVRFFAVMRDYYTVQEQQTVQVSWGLPEQSPVSEWTSTNPITPEVSLLSQGAAPLATEEGQRAALQLCRSADAERCESEECLVFGSGGSCMQNRTLVGNVSLPSDPYCATGRYCFMEWVEEYAGAAGIGFPVPQAEFVPLLQSAGFRGYLSEREAANEQAGRHWDSSLERRQTGWIVEEGELKFAWITFNASFKARGTKDVLNEWHRRWEDHVRSEVGATDARQSSQMYVFMVLQNELLSAAIQGIVVSLAVTAVILALVTFNWVLALIGLLNIGVITVVFLGVMPLIPWELGSNECIFLIAVVGLAVDYTVHLLHAYNEQDGSREDKMQGALSTMGISVASGAITTMGAGLMLFMCDIAFFQQYGSFIFLVILISLLAALTNLPPLILIVGPEGDSGKIAPLFWLADKLATRRRGRNTADSAGASGPEAEVA